MNMRSLIIAAAVFLTAGCGQEGETQVTAETAIEEPVLQIPGSLQIPAGQGLEAFNEETHEAVLLYCWLPMGEYQESQGDLEFLATLGSRNITAVPVQFSPEVRNAAQNQLNSMGIPLGVALGDDSLRNFMGTGMLPSAVLVLSSGDVHRETGFGSAERAVRSGS